MSDLQIITKSRLQTFGSCQRLHHLRYNLGYRPLVEGDALAWGTLLHAGLEAWWKAHQSGGASEALEDAQRAIVEHAAKTPAIDLAALTKAQIVMTAYDARWAPTMDEWEVLGVELEFIAAIPGRRRLRVAGKLDALARKRSDGTVWFVEHKTTGADLSAGSTYWVNLRMDPQVSIYFGGCRALGYEPSGCLYDVIDRPNEKPLKATPEEKRKYTKPTKKDPVPRLYANQRELDETLDEFQERVAARVSADPDMCFARAEVVRLESELEESAKDVEAIALQIRDSATADHAPRNPGACHLYGRTCEFHGPCSGAGDINDPTLYKRVENVHQELALTA